MVPRKRELTIPFLRRVLQLVNNDPWIICGDLNLILDSYDKIGGAWASPRQHKYLGLWNKYNLMERGIFCLICNLDAVG